MWRFHIAEEVGDAEGLFVFEGAGDESVGEDAFGEVVEREWIEEGGVGLCLGSVGG